MPLNTHRAGYMARYKCCVIIIIKQSVYVKPAQRNMEINDRLSCGVCRQSFVNSLNVTREMLSPQRKILKTRSL